MPGVISKLLDSGGLLAVLAPIGMIVLILLLYGLTKCFKVCLIKYTPFRKLVNNIIETVFFGAILRVVLTGFLPIVVSSGVGNNYGNHPETVIDWP
jgi:hypothetical protein